MKRLASAITAWLTIGASAAPPATQLTVPATQPSAPATASVTTPPSRPETAVDLALLHLERRQHAEGHFQADPKLAVTALVLTSFLATGNVPDHGRHGGTVRRAVDHLVRSAPADGYFGRVDGGRMYGQAICVIALSQAYGVEQDRARRSTMRAALVNAVKVIVDAQNVKKEPPHAGGWRYEPGAADSDLSVSAWNAVALRAAREIGLEVPDAAIAAAAAYVKRCAHPAAGGFGYQPGGESGVAMTGAGLITLSLLSTGDTPEVAAGAKFLREHPVVGATRFPYYAMYHATQAADHVGGETWTVVSRAAQERLLRTQLPSGAWPASTSPEEPGEVYATAMAVLTLGVPRRLLPLYQR